MDSRKLMKKEVSPESESSYEQNVESSFMIESPVAAENRRAQLIEQAEVLLKEKKIEAVKSVIYTSNFLVLLSSKGISFSQTPTSKDEQAKYQKALDRFYVIKNQNDNSNDQVNQEMADVLGEKQKGMKELNDLKTELTDTVFQTGVSLINSYNGQFLPEKFVTKLINQFLKTQENLSSARLDFIIEQNSQTELMNKEIELDDLGEGFKVFDYENLMNDIQTISSNIDMKNEQLETLRQRHRSEKQKLVTANGNHSHMLKIIEKQKSKRESFCEKEALLRRNLHYLKTQKYNLRDEINELSQKSEILTKIPLMKNYDKISDETEKLSKQIFAAEETNKKYMEKIEAIKSKIKELVKEKQKKIQFCGHKKF